MTLAKRNGFTLIELMVVMALTHFMLLLTLSH